MHFYKLFLMLYSKMNALLQVVTNKKSTSVVQETAQNWLKNSRLIFISVQNTIPKGLLFKLK